MSGARELVLTERRYLIDELTKIGNLLVIPSHANFLFIDIRKTDYAAEELKKRLLEKYGLLIRNCATFRGLDKFWIRIAIRKHSDNRILIRALRELLLQGRVDY